VENSRTEYKRELNDRFERTIVGFLNSMDGGAFYIGIDDDESVYGVPDIDQTQQTIVSKMATNFLPSVLGLYDVFVERRDGQDVVKIALASGPQKPYHIAQYGMSPKGCFIRVGSATIPMTVEMIEEMRSQRPAGGLDVIASRRQDLSFEQLRIFYEEKKKKLNDKFMETLELLTKDKEPNYVAYLMADENGNSMKFAKFWGTDKKVLIENYEYGYCSLVKAVKNILSRVEVENTIKADVQFHGRIEKPLIDKAAIKEAIINAAVHNDYSTEIPPVVMFFSDRVEITSMGRLPHGVTQENFFDGTSRPRNKEIIRIFKDLDLVEHLGTGIQKITDVYGKEAYKFYSDHLTVVLPFDKEVLALNTGESKNAPINAPIKLSKTQTAILEMLKEDNTLTRETMCERLGKDIGTIKRAIKALREKGMIERKGANKDGYWEVKNGQS
jgi:predicted HTH transcriptional regulator